ncbi:hypothetical protein [Streptomyces sp. MUM 178J]|uniref:hypothetical protein n=1 Tax=Streptomyces sp. MUM 178J TaxID=2791991 RepID=UPI001F0395D9|nr:hypothetical protein [Streptomyces sp. MUM 178J]WRQ82123.1 hypothetical protein I3F59_023735 [Streptomyces sp. MUM 178J]
MTTQEKLNWPRDEDETWAAAVELRLALAPHSPEGLAGRVLAEAYEAVTETGRSARELFGEPEAYARAAADEHVTEEARARTDSRGMTPGERFTAALVAVGGTGIAISVIRWIREGLWVTPSWSSIAAFAGIAVGALLFCAGIGAWSAGRIKGAGGFGAAAGAALGNGIAAAVYLPDDELLRMPVPVLAAAGALLAAAAAGIPNAVLDRWFAPSLPHGDDERWLSRLESLLRTRHAMRAAEAHSHVQEARLHLATSGESAADAFDDVEVYALRLAEGPRREARLERRKLYGVTLLAAAILVVLVDKLADPEPTSFWFWLYVVTAVYWVGHTAARWRQALRRR